MGLNIVCCGYLLRYPLGGFSFHHLQYLVGLRQLGHNVVYFEDQGWPDSCYDPRRDEMTSDFSYGLAYLRELMQVHGLADHWCFLTEAGDAHGIPRDALTDAIRECDLFINLGNVNWIDELELCRRRVLIDTDPVFTQIDGHGLRTTLERHHVLFTYGENVHRKGCSMPTAGLKWLPTRQPVVPTLWPVERGEVSSPISTIMNWSAYGAKEHEGRVYGQKDLEFQPFLSLPRRQRFRMLMAVGASGDVEERLVNHGWENVDARHITRDPASYQRFIRSSKAEFSVAKHGYVTTQCGWFSDRSTGYLASGRPVVVQDTGFSRFLPTGKGLLAWRTPQQAIEALRRVDDNYQEHCHAARAVVEEHFDSRIVLQALLERSF